MNIVRVSGFVAGDSELRVLDSGRELLNFDVCIDGVPGKDPIVHCAYFPQEGGDVRKLNHQDRIAVSGSLRHRFDARLFIAVKSIRVFDGANEKESNTTERLTK